MDEFEWNFPTLTELFHDVNHPEVSGTKVHLDLWDANRRQLLDAGLA